MIQEISAHLKHQDYSLVVRRMLDLSLDVQNPALMREVIQWSRNYHQAEKEKQGSGATALFLNEADRLLSQLERLAPAQTNGTVRLIEADQVSKTYSKGNFSLKPISLQIDSGQIMGIVGENGNGKTTLLRCLAGQLALTRGSVMYGLLNQPDQYEVRSYVAFIPQRIPRWYGLLKDNLHFSAAIAGIHGDENNLMVDFMLERLNLSSYANLNWNQISSGYRTRFEVARILLQRPKLLILDEPLANLDINAQQTILTDLQFLTKSNHHPMGIVLSSQQLHEVEKIADSVMFIKQGECLFQTNTTAVVENSVVKYVMEIETSASRESIITLFGNSDIQIQFNGGYYTLSSTQLSCQDIVGKLVNNNVPIAYFRDITHSTKRFF
jgi:ABC-2 type transport system ATP-binding protein